MTIVIAGFATSDKRPMAFRETKYGQGRNAVGSAPFRLLCSGAKQTGSGTLTDDSSVSQVFSEDDAVTKLGAHSELTSMAIAAMLIPGVEVWVAPVAPAGGAVAASATILVGGTASNGTIRGRVGGHPFSIGVSSSDAVNTVATNLQLAIEGIAKCPAVATVSTATVTVEAGFAGARGNQILIWLDSSECPNLTFTITGGTALHTSATLKLVPLGGGSGADSVTNVLALLDDEEYHMMAFAQNDSVNMALIKTYLATVAMPGVSFLQHVMYGFGGTYAAALALTTTTLNDQRESLLWQENSETLPCVIAAIAAALRSNIVPQQPNYKWAVIPLPGVTPQSYKSDRPGAATQIACLNNGITPLLTQRDNTVVMQRAIVTHCLNGTDPDYRTLDWADADVPDRVSREIGSLWDLTAQANPYADDDSGPEDPQPPAGVITPSRWNGLVTAKLRELEKANMVTAVGSYLPTSEWDADRKCIMSAIPTVVRPKSFQLGASIRQVSR